MLELVQSQIIFYLTIALVLFVPGYFMLLAVFGREKLSALERFVISVGVSILVTDFLMLIMSRVGILFNRASLILTLLIFSAGCFAIYKKRFKKSPEAVEAKSLFNFSSKQFYFILLVLFLSVFIRSAYLQNALPSSGTDFGHHMYWSKLFAQNGRIQDYTQRDIVEKNEVFQIDAERPISDFIIGEHLIFSAINLISGLDFISVFPVSALLLINIFSLLALFILSLRLFENHPQNKNIAIFALLLLGALFAIDPPQAKFVGGGVVGNIIGNLLLPLAFYFYIRYLREKTTTFLFFALFFSMGLFYTHHLTAFIFLLAFAIFVLLSLMLNFKETKNFIFSEKKILISPLLLSFYLFAIILMLGVYMPSYLRNSAVNTVVGTIKKIEHTGLTLLQFRDILGEARIALGILGIFLLFAYYRKNTFKYSALLVASWVIIISLISLVPNLIKIDIPSSRVANYGAYPFALLGAFAFVSVFWQNKTASIQLSSTSRKLILGTYLMALVFIFLDGYAGNVDFLKVNSTAQKTQETLGASGYLSTRLDAKDLLISDHLYLAADSWIKLFFMRGYNFPVYRANLDRYENGIDKNEFCSRDMLSNPGGELGLKCYSDLGANFVMVDKEMDSGQFQKLDNFWQIYSNDKINAYYREK
ncbi:MAG: DUF1616 domain-containing protein [Candidatus Moranbacteria bacterium]|nr:DUF1616 domain-containing protein [Candidatus Moranbacteria bacterium]